MGNLAKIFLSIAAFFILLGGVLFLVMAISVGFNFKKLGAKNYENNTHETSEEFSNILIETSTANINFLPSEDEKCKVVCYELKKVKHVISVEDNTLKINEVNKRKWYDYININFNKPKLTIYLPESEYLSLVIKEDTGDIKIENFKFESIDISLATGDIDLTNISCKKLVSKGSTGYVVLKDFVAEENISITRSTGDVKLNKVESYEIYIKTSTGNIGLTNINSKLLKTAISTGKTSFKEISCNELISQGSTGDITLNNVIAEEKISITRKTGDVKFSEIDALEIYIKTSTGDVVGSILTDKVYIVNTDTGKIDVPKTITGGRCEINTSTGNIKITVNK